MRDAMGSRKTDNPRFLQSTDQPSHFTVKCYVSVICLTFLKGKRYNNNFSKQQTQRNRFNSTLPLILEHCKADAYSLDLSSHPFFFPQAQLNLSFIYPFHTFLFSF